MDDMSMGEPVKGPAQEAVDRLLDQGFLDELMSRVDEGGCVDRGGRVFA